MSDPTTPDPERRDPIFLGDGVYAAHDGIQVWLRTDNADWYQPNPRGVADIALEPTVLAALFAYAIRVGYFKPRKT
jgi:hypothetical protein